MNTHREKCRYLGIYTILFSFCFLMCFVWYFIEKRSFVWNSDGWIQHYKAMIYYAEHLRSIVTDIFVNHKFNVPEWGMYIGEGADILQTFHYYVIGDPFTVFCVFVPTKYMSVFYGLTVVAKLYCSGLSFSFLCFSNGKKEKKPVMVGAICYAFCLWSVLNAGKHPFFLNPMVFFPLVIAGTEKIFQKKSPLLLSVSVFLSAVSHFYFFYMTVVLTVVYVLEKLLFSEKRSLREVIDILRRMFVYSLFGVLMAAVIIFPMLNAFVENGRSDISYGLHLLYPVKSYVGGLIGLVSAYAETGYWFIFGFNIFELLSIVLLLLDRKKNRFLKALLFTGIIICLFPFFGRILNGNSYATNRWIWALSLLVCYLTTEYWDKLMSPSDIERRWMIAFVIVLTVGLMPYVILKKGWWILASMLLALVVVIPNRYALLRKKSMYIALMLGVIIISIELNSPFGRNYARTHLKYSEINSQLVTAETEILREVVSDKEAEGYFRYTGDNLERNENIISGFSGTATYWTLMNPSLTDFNTEIAIAKSMPHSIVNYDSRAALNALANIRYFIAEDKTYVPYGFSYVDELQGRYVYKNDYELPLFYAYTGHIKQATWDAMSPLQKQEALLQGVMLEDYNGDLGEAELIFNQKEIQYKLKTGKKVKYFKKKRYINVKKEKGKISLSFNGLRQAETYLYLEGLDYIPAKSYFTSGVTDAGIIVKASSGISDGMLYATKDSTFGYGGRHNFAYALQYKDRAEKMITLMFKQTGKYPIDKIKVICLPMNNYASQIEELQKHIDSEIDIQTDTVNGRVKLDTKAAVAIGIPYSKGWRAEVDGIEEKIYRANTKNMAVVLEPGEHEIKLTYHTPFLRLGLIVSILSWGFFGGILVFNKTGIKKLKKDVAE